MTAAVPSESPPSSPTPVRRWAGRLLRLLLAILPLWWLSTKVAWGDVWLSARRVGFASMSASFVAAFASYLFGCIRWRIMMRAYGAREVPSVLTMLRHNLIGGYFNVLPSGVAGDAVRGHRVQQYLPSLATSYTVIFVERITGLLGLCVIAGAAILLSNELHADTVALTLELGLLGAFGLSLVVLFLPYVLLKRPALRDRWLMKVPVVGDLLAKIPPARSLRGPLLATLLSVLTQGVVILSVALLLRPLAPSVSFVTCARIVPAVILFTYVPLTPGGLGQREAAFVYLFGLVGVSASIATATSLLFFGIGMALAGLGGLTLLLERTFSIEDRVEKAT